MKRTESGTQPKSTPIRALFVDDYGHTLAAHAAAIRYKGIHAEVARDGDAALVRAALTLPDAIVTDVRIRGSVDGFALAQRLRSHPRTARIPVIAVTGLVARDQIERAIQAGCVALLAKPCTFDLLHRTIVRVVQEQLDLEERLMA